tara:strand:- start:1115 stop:2269 length:1155 start_codon:yes stop_codon:yes gene_type:complete
MASITGMKTGNFTDINLQGSLRVGDTLNPGVVGQVLISNGEGQATEWGTNSAVVPNALTAGSNVSFSSGNASWDGAIADTINATDTDTTYQGSATINIDTTTNPDTINCIKVPNALTAGTNITFSSGTTYDGSTAITINATDTDTTYSAGDGISIGGTVIETKIDEDTIDYDGSGTMEVVKVPNGLSAGTNLSYTSGSTFDGDTARTINLDSSPTNLDLSDSTNIISPYFFHNVYDPSSSDFDSLSTTYSALLLSNVNVNIVAKQASLCVELLCFNYGSSSNRFTYCRLTDNGGTEFSTGTNQGGYGTGTVNTERLIHGMDETDKQIFRITWYIQGLTIGNTYTFNPQAKTSSTYNYIAAGGTYPATILRGYYLPTTSGGGGGA